LAHACGGRRAPDALYENGLQRDLFLPFIERLKQHARVHDISSATDYRRLAQHRAGLFYTPEGFADPDAEVDAQFAALAAACHSDAEPVEVEVAMGRHLHVPAASARFPLTLPCSIIRPSAQPCAVQWSNIILL
jgi:cell division protein ZapE